MLRIIRANGRGGGKKKKKGGREERRTKNNVFPTLVDGVGEGEKRGKGRVKGTATFGCVIRFCSSVRKKKRIGEEGEEALVSAGTHFSFG